MALGYSTPTAIGILLKDVLEFDENGKKLIFDSRKAAEMDAIIVNVQAVPILTKGIVLINAIDTYFGNIDFGDSAYLGNNGCLATGFNENFPTPVVGRFLSKQDENGYALVKVNFN
jgi:hypothetical protein